MNAKVVTSIFVMSFLAFSFNSSRAEGSKKDQTPKPVKVEIKKMSQNVSHRPKAPSLQQIDCIYADENLYISFAIPEGDCNMTVTDLATGLSVQYVFDTEESAEIHVGTLSSAYLELETENGHSYEGWIE